MSLSCAFNIDENITVGTVSETWHLNLQHLLELSEVIYN